MIVKQLKAIYYWIAPLYYFDADFDNIILTEGVEIRRTPKEFKEYLLRQNSEWFETKPSDNEYVLLFSQYIDNQYPDSNYCVKTEYGIWNVVNLVEFLTTAMRLCHTGLVSPGPILFSAEQNSKFYIYGKGIEAQVNKDLPPEAERGAFTSHITKLGELYFASSKHQYFLHKNDVPKIIKFFDIILDLNRKEKTENLNIVLSRFNSSYCQEFAERNEQDRLVDQVIALESLFVGDDKELTYKLALRSAFLLTNYKKKRKAIISNMKKAYAIRSQIVHGNKPVEKETVLAISKITEEYLRQSIIKFLLLFSRGYGLKTLRDRLLDENIIENGKLLNKDCSL